MLPVALGFSSWIYGIVATLTGLGFVYLAVRLWRQPAGTEMRRAARALFTFSLSYLFVLFLGLLTDHIALQMGVL